MSKGIFITGTDTAVGKTFVATALLRVLKEKGLRVCPLKPVETGCLSKRGKLIPADALKLMHTAGVDEDIDLINPYRLKNPLAPSVAAELEGVTIQTATIVSAYKRLSMKYEVIIVEGAGGIMVPVFNKYLTLDLINDLGLPVLIVARPGLGTVNHTLMTIAAARSKNIDVLGVVLNSAMKTRKGLAEKTNPHVVEKLGGVPVLGNIEYLDENNRELDCEFITIADKILLYP